MDKDDIAERLTKHDVVFNIVRKHKDGFIIVRKSPPDPGGIEAWVSRVELALHELYVSEFKRTSHPTQFRATVYEDKFK